MTQRNRPFSPKPMPRVYGDLPFDEKVWMRLQRYEHVIALMHDRDERNPVRSLLIRKPWRAPSRPPRVTSLRGLRDFVRWLRAAHDCSDPRVACSCAGGFLWGSD